MKLLSIVKIDESQVQIASKKKIICKKDIFLNFF